FLCGGIGCSFRGCLCGSPGFGFVFCFLSCGCFLFSLFLCRCVGSSFRGCLCGSPGLSFFLSLFLRGGIRSGFGIRLRFGLCRSLRIRFRFGFGCCIGCLAFSFLCQQSIYLRYFILGHPFIGLYSQRLVVCRFGIFI